MPSVGPPLLHSEFMLGSLQVPRGNLEAIHHRALVLAQVRKWLDRWVELTNVYMGWPQTVQLDVSAIILELTNSVLPLLLASNLKKRLNVWGSCESISTCSMTTIQRRVETLGSVGIFWRDGRETGKRVLWTQMVVFQDEDREMAPLFANTWSLRVINTFTNS